MSGSVLDASWALLGAFGDALGALGRVSELFWRLLGALGRPSWELRGPSWDHLESSLELFGPHWSLSGASEALGKPFGRSWEPFGLPKGSQKVPKMDPGGSKNHFRNASHIEPLSTCNVMSFFDDILMW